MTIEELKQIVKETESLENIESAIVDDYNSEEATILIKVADPKISLKKISGQLRSFLNKNGFSTKRGNIIEWIPPQKRTTDFSIVIDSRYYQIDLAYKYAKKTTPKFKKDVLVFEKHNYSGKSSKKLEEIFRSTFKNSSNEEEHMEKIEKVLKGYDVYTLYKYEHSGIVFELSPRCQFDSGVTGCIAIKEGSEITAEDVVIDLNNQLEEE
jgi:hypothetical protein